MYYNLQIQAKQNQNTQSPPSLLETSLNLQLKLPSRQKGQSSGCVPLNTFKYVATDAVLQNPCITGEIYAHAFHDFCLLPKQRPNTATNDRVVGWLFFFQNKAANFKLKCLEKRDTLINWGVVPLHIPCSPASASLQQGALSFPPRWCFPPQGNATAVVKILSAKILLRYSKVLVLPIYCCYKRERHYIYQETSRVCITKGKIRERVLDPETAELHTHPHSLSNLRTKWKMGLTGNMFLRTAIYGCAKGGSSKVKRILSLHLRLFKFFITILTVCLLVSFLCISGKTI